MKNKLFDLDSEIFQMYMTILQVIIFGIIVLGIAINYMMLIEIGLILELVFLVILLLVITYSFFTK